MVRFQYSTATPIHSSHSDLIQKVPLLLEDAAAGLHQFSQFKFAPGAAVEPHSHPDLIEIYYVVRGEFLVTVGGLTFNVHESDGFRVDRGEVHSLKNASAGSAELLLFVVRPPQANIRSEEF